jgi:hypothetical protein
MNSQNVQHSQTKQEPQLRWTRQSDGGFIKTHDSLPKSLSDTRQVLIDREIDDVWIRGSCSFEFSKAKEIIQQASDDGLTNQFVALFESTSYDGKEFHLTDGRVLSRQQVLDEGLGHITQGWDGFSALELHQERQPITAYRIVPAPEPAAKSKVESDHVADERNDYVFNLLSDAANHTEPVIMRLLEQSYIATRPSQNTLQKMAMKFLWILWNSERIRGKGKGWVPTQSCVDLTTTGAQLTIDEDAMSVDEVRELWAFDSGAVRRKSSRKTLRHFKNCRQCGKRFLAKRASQEFDGKKCGLRWNRAHASSRMMLETAQAAPQAA